jgi:hypothetical protein
VRLGLADLIIVAPDCSHDLCEPDDLNLEDLIVSAMLER